MYVPIDDRLSPVVVGDERRTFKSENHSHPPEYEGHFQSLILSSVEIRQRIRDLAQLVTEDLGGRRPLLICTLKGACPFFTHLSDAFQDLRQGYDIEFVRASSYHGTSSTGEVNLAGELRVESLQGRHVIIIEDIVDTGTTLSVLVPYLREKGNPAALQICALLDKRLEPSKKKFSAHYVGFSIPDVFVVGYGLDYNELYRDLKDIFEISELGIKFDRSSLKL